MKNPKRMSMNELLSLPVISARHILDRVDTLGGCFRDREGVLWGTCLIGDAWARYQAVRLSGVSASVISQYSALRGFIDFCDGRRIDGWAQDEANPDEAVYLDIVVDGKSVVQTHADRFRADLLAAGVGNGRHAFTLPFPKPLSRDANHLVVIQRVGDGGFINMALVAKEEAVA